MTATIDGQPFRATIVVAFIASGGDARRVLTLTGLEGCSTGRSVYLLAERLPVGQPFGMGTYSTSMTQQVGTATSFATYREMTPSTYILQQGAYSYWDVPGPFGTGGSGTLQVSNLTATHVEGTFSFDAVARTGNTISGATKSVTSGAFRAVLRDTRIC